MYRPIRIGAVDAGTNAIRVVVAQAESPTEIVRIHKERWPVRLGHNVFTGQRFDQKTLDQATEAFSHFRRVFDRFEVDRYRAVATSATREAENRDVLLRQISRSADIDLEVIDGREEARLTRDAVGYALGEEHQPEVIVDIGGGSLEINVLEGGEPVDSVSLPIGTVRLMETFGIYGRMDESAVTMVRRFVTNLLDDYYEDPEDLPGRGAVGCGGNVEDLAEIYPGDDLYGHDALDLGKMDEEIERVTDLNIRERMTTFGVRRDRAEVMAIAGVVLGTVGRIMNIERLSAPDVGVREGVLLEEASRAYAPEDPLAAESRRAYLLSACRDFGRRFRRTTDHTEHVRKLAASMFDQLADRFELDAEHRLVLECAALLHEIGYAVSRGGRHRHAAYLIQNGNIEGLDERMRTLVACVVRHHRKSFPAPRHDIYMSLDKRDRPKAALLAGMLRIADGLDANFQQVVDDVDVIIEGDTARFVVETDVPTELPCLGAEQKAHLFEVASELRPTFEARST
jgi:exopolyphosphatase/guanosine-5'-triphosphate,3'-diphosphate pyrophosphatase